jgi:polysaccharide pyruvyl transferase WcaK-like protein
MSTITIATYIGFCNRGAEALLKTRIKLLKKLIPDLNFKVLSIYTETCRPIKNVEYIDTFGGRKEKLKSIKYILSSLYKGVTWTLNAYIYRFCNFSFNKEINKISKSSIFISTDGDVLGEDYGLFPLLWRIYYLSLGLIMKKPVFIFSEGTGPFKSKISKTISRVFFKQCTYISVRDEISLKHLINIGLKKEKLILAADSAFLLLPSPKKLDYRDHTRKLIGISVSKLVTDFGFNSTNSVKPYDKFTSFIAKLIDWIIAKYDSKIILISHVVQINRDDYKTAKEIFFKVKRKDHVEIMKKSFDSTEIKKVISYCNLIITSRMHAAIAALSTHVPAIGISYSHKMEGIFKRLEIPEYVIDIKKLDWKITKIIQQALSNSENIKNRIKKNMPNIIRFAQKPAYKIAKILNKQ